MSHKRVLSSVTVLRLFFALYSVATTLKTWRSGNLKVVMENSKSQENVFLPVCYSVIHTR